MQHILSTVRQAVDKYGMIEENDTVAVGLSGGKDSIALLTSLDRLKNFYPKKFSVVGISVDMGFDDAAETFMLTLVNEGRIGCYSPVTVYEDTAVTVIRPLIYTREADIRSLVKKENLPVVKSPCPEDGNTDRAEIKNVIRELEINHRGLKKRIITAMEKRGLDGWQ